MPDGIGRYSSVNPYRGSVIELAEYYCIDVNYNYPKAGGQAMRWITMVIKPAIPI